MWLTNTKAVPITNSSYLYWFGSGKVFSEIPILFIWALVATIIGHIVLKNTAYGRKVLSVGGNRVAAGYSGVKVKRVELTAFIVMGMLAGLAGCLYTGRAQAARCHLVIAGEAQAAGEDVRANVRVFAVGTGVHWDSSIAAAVTNGFIR